MSSLGSPNPFFIAGKKAYEIERSLRFNDDDSPWLERTVSSSSNRRTFTISAWLKRSTLGSGNIFGQTDTSGSYMFYMVFDSTHSLYILDYDYPSNNYHFVTNRKFRDTSAWYHIVLAVDTTQATNTNRSKLYINGVQETSFSTANYPAQNLQMFVNHTTYPVRIGRNGWSHTSYFDGYMAEYNFIDGLQLTPSSFGETDVLTGQWNPKKYVGSYGTNGFYLNFSDNSGTTATTLGKDSSGNGNNFTPNNFQVNDAVKDSPTNNFCTWNPLENFDNVSLSEGNLRANGVAGFDMIKGNMGVSSGKWYFEIRADSIYANTWSVGIHELYPNPNYPQAYWYANYYTAADYGYVYAVMDNNKRCTNGSQTTFTSDITDGDIVGLRLDLDNNELSISVNGTDKGKVYDIQSGVTYTPAQQGYATTSMAVLNCGQDSTFAGAVSSGGNADANGIGDFKYAVPSGYKAICSANLPDPTIKLPNKHFEARAYTGTGAGNTQTLTGFQFAPDWVWGKSRTSAYNHGMFDTVRGATNRLWPNLTNAEASNNALTAFTSDGYSVSTDAFNQNSQVTWNWNAGDTDGKTYTVTVVSDSGNKYRFDGYGTSAVTLDLAEGGTYIFNYPSAHPFRFSTTSDGTHGGGSEYTTGVTVISSTSIQIVVAASAPQLYYYCSIHSGMGGAINTNSTLGSSNFDGAIQSTVKVNPTAGFSIVTYTGTGSTATVGHGLGVAPEVILLKDRNATAAWKVLHKEAVSGSYEYFKNVQYLNSSGTFAGTGNSYPWGNTEPTSSVFSLGNIGSESNRSGSISSRNYVAYCFSGVAGYSKFGSYKGNANANGTFVFTGFKISLLIIKNTASSGDYWLILDNKRRTFNPNGISSSLYANESLAEGTFGSGTGIDFLSNGFKIRDSNSRVNGSGNNIIYLAFAESPFKNARAR